MIYLAGPYSHPDPAVRQARFDSPMTSEPPNETQALAEIASLLAAALLRMQKMRRFRDLSEFCPTGP